MFKFLDVAFLGLLAIFIGLAAIGSFMNPSLSKNAFGQALVFLYILFMIILILIFEKKKQKINFIYCPKCGKPQSLDTQFCGQCGVKIIQTSPLIQKSYLTPAQQLASPQLLIPVAAMVGVTYITKDSNIIGGIILISAFMIIRTNVIIFSNIIRDKMKKSP